MQSLLSAMNRAQKIELGEKSELGQRFRSSQKLESSLKSPIRLEYRIVDMSPDLRAIFKMELWCTGADSDDVDDPCEGDRHHQLHQMKHPCLNRF